MALDGIPFVANGSIMPSRGVMIDPTATGGNRVIQAVAGSRCIGISKNSQRLAKTPFQNDVFAAVAGDPIRCYTNGELAPVELGATVAPNDRVKSDVNGRMIPTTTTGDEIVGIAIQGGAVGEVIQIEVTPERI